MSILAIDPGPEKSGWCVYDDMRSVECGVSDNHTILNSLNDMGADWLAIEAISSYGMAVGASVFETCIWIGRFQQAWVQPAAVRLIYRKDIKLHLCGTTKAKDPNVRQALIDLFPRSGGGKRPQIGTKAKPGPLFGVSSHAWSALAVAIVAHHEINQREVV